MSGNAPTSPVVQAQVAADARSAPCAPTYTDVWVADSLCASRIVESVLSKTSQIADRRLMDVERATLAKSGNVFVFNTKIGGMQRWTDGFHWSNSRKHGNFFFYRQLRGPKKRRARDEDDADADADAETPALATNGMMAPSAVLKSPTGPTRMPTASAISSNKRKAETFDEEVSDDGNVSYIRHDSPTSPTQPASAQTSFSAKQPAQLSTVRQNERTIYASLVDPEGTRNFKPGGLIKKTVSVKVGGLCYRLVSYYDPLAVERRELLDTSSKPELRGLQARAEILYSPSWPLPHWVEELEVPQSIATAGAIPAATRSAKRDRRQRTPESEYKLRLMPPAVQQHSYQWPHGFHRQSQAYHSSSHGTAMGYEPPMYNLGAPSTDSMYHNNPSFYATYAPTPVMFNSNTHASDASPTNSTHSSAQRAILAPYSAMPGATSASGHFVPNYLTPTPPMTTPVAYTFSHDQSLVLPSQVSQIYMQPTAQFHNNMGPESFAAHMDAANSIYWSQAPLSMAQYVHDHSANSAMPYQPMAMPSANNAIVASPAPTPVSDSVTTQPYTVPTTFDLWHADPVMFPPLPPPPSTLPATPPPASNKRRRPNRPAPRFSVGEGEGGWGRGGGGSGNQFAEEAGTGH